jgi:hypothetical protein
MIISLTHERAIIIYKMIDETSIDIVIGGLKGLYEKLAKKE